MINAGTHGAVTWVDLSTPDVEAAATFYEKLLDWSEVEASETPMGKYFIGKVGEHQVGGMMGQSGHLIGTPPVWSIFVYVDDVAETAARVPDVGGAVVAEPFDIPGGARIAVVADPAGAAFGLFGGPEINGEFFSEDIGRVCWVELMSRDPSGVEEFYGQLFGWTAVVENVSPTGADYISFKIGEEPVAGMMRMPDAVPPEVPSYWSAYFTVRDCARAVQEVAEMGGQVFLEPTAIDDGQFASMADPQGAAFNVFQFT